MQITLASKGNKVKLHYFERITTYTKILLIVIRKELNPWGSRLENVSLLLTQNNLV